MILTPTFVILLIVVFILVWLFTNTIDKRKWLTFLISVILAPVVYFFVFYPILNIFSSYHHEKYFDADAWKEQPKLRYEMANNIVSDSLLIGKSKNDVEAFLGKPEWLGWDETIKADSQDKWNYNMGLKPGALNNMQECIEIQFKNGNAQTVTTYQLENTFE
jgi:type IV secretory pathway VirB6-like protein